MNAPSYQTVETDVLVIGAGGAGLRGAIAAAEGHPPGGPFFQRTRGLLTADGSPMTASMFRDVRAGLPVEADHVIGDLVARADDAKIPVPKLRIAYTHLKAYEKQRG